jgi:hypothetical protein
MEGGKAELKQKLGRKDTKLLSFVIQKKKVQTHKNI